MTGPISKDREKIIKYDKDLFQRFPVVSRSQEIDLQDVLSYELSPVPLSIAHLNGSMRKTAKSNLLKELIIDINIPDHLPVHDLSSTIHLIDFMVLVQSTQTSRERVIHNERTPLLFNFKEFLMNAKNKVSFISFVLNFLVEYLPSVLLSHQEVILGRLDGSSWRISSHGKEQLPELFCDHEEADSRPFYACFLLLKQ